MAFPPLKASGVTRFRPRGKNVGHRLLIAGVVALGGLALLALPCTLWSRAARADKTKAGKEISLEAARALAAKIQVLSSLDSGLPASFQPMVITEVEANSYLKYRGHEFLPPGVHNSEIHIAPERVSGAADVDFNELNQTGTGSEDWGAKILALVFKGRQRVTASGRLATGKGRGRVTIEKVAVGTTVIPAGFVNFVLENYVQNRYNIDLSKPFILPDHVTHIELGNGRATLHRSAYKNQ